MDALLINQQTELLNLIQRHTAQEGVSTTAIPSLYFIKLSAHSEKAYRVYKPSFCYIAQGRKQMWLAKEHFEYGPSHFLVSSIHLPVIGQVIKATTQLPYLSLKLEFTQHQILEILQVSEFLIPDKKKVNRAMFVGAIEQGLLDAVLRLARLLDHPQDLAYLAPIYTKELLFRLLQTPYGAALAQTAMAGSHSFRIQAAIEEVIRNFDKALRIETLAEKATMSISTFHRVFKEVTAMSPLQFQKNIRLQEARRLLLTESADAADVGFRVGYESASQFSREYSRLFGSPPKADINQLRKKLVQTD